jgi:hypothetical protein
LLIASGYPEGITQEGEIKNLSGDGEVSRLGLLLVSRIPDFSGTTLPASAGWWWWKPEGFTTLWIPIQLLAYFYQTPGMMSSKENALIARERGRPNYPSRGVMHSGLSLMGLLTQVLTG